MAEFVCAVDLGSSFIKAALIDELGNIATLARLPAPTPAGEHGRFDAEDCFTKACEVIADVVARCEAGPNAVGGLALSSQRASLVPVGSDDRPSGSAWSWQGTGCEQAANRFYGRFGPGHFRAITGLMPSAIYSAAKLAHLRESDPDQFRSVRRFVLLHDYVLRRFGAEGYFTDPSNGSATGLMDTATRRWSKEVLEALGLEAERLPTCRDAGSRVGGLHSRAARATGLLPGTPLYVGGGDQQCAVLGAGAVEPGTCVLSLGTAAVSLCPVDRPADPSVGGVLCGAHIPSGQWVIEGFQSSFGSAFQWIGNLVGTSSLMELEQLAARASADAGDLIFLPFLSGIGSPDYDGSTRGALLGASLSHGSAELARAVFEGVAMEARRIVEEVNRIVPVGSLRVVGGGSDGDVLPQILADAIGLDLELLGETEAALLGAAAIAWTGAGRFENVLQAALTIGARVRKRVAHHPRSADGRIRYERYVQSVACVRAMAPNRQSEEGR